MFPELVACYFIAGGLCHQRGYQHGQPGPAVWGLDCLGVNAMLLHVFGPAKAWRSTRVQWVWGVRTAAPGHTGGEEMGSGCLVLPPKLGQRPRSTAATTLPQPSAIGLTQRLVGLRPHLPFWGLTRQSSAEWGRGEESHDLFTLDSEIPPPLTCIAHYQVVPINISASFWANQTPPEGRMKQEVSFFLKHTVD